jgi:RNA polymerase sigma-19 factor, ECF subfamily
MEIASLILDFSKGDQRAFKQVFDMFLSEFVYFATKITTNRHEAEDIVLDAFRKLWLKHDQFKTIENIRAFLYVTVRNNCLNYIKHEDCKRKAQNEIRYTSGTATHESIENHVHEKMSNDDHLRRFNEEVEALPDQCKEIFKLYLAGYNNAQIAEKLNITPNTVHVQKNRAMKKLRSKVIEKGLSKPTLKFIFSIFYC